MTWHPVSDDDLPHPDIFDALVDGLDEFGGAQATMTPSTAGAPTASLTVADVSDDDATEPAIIGIYTDHKTGDVTVARWTP